MDEEKVIKKRKKEKKKKSYKKKKKRKRKEKGSVRLDWRSVHLRLFCRSMDIVYGPIKVSKI